MSQDTLNIRTRRLAIPGITHGVAFGLKMLDCYGSSFLEPLCQGFEPSFQRGCSQQCLFKLRELGGVPDQGLTAETRW